MEIRLQREELLTELTLLQGIVERRTTIPILSHLLLEVSSDRLNLAATDLDVSLVTWCRAEAGDGGSIAVQAKKFSEIIRSLGDEEVTLVVDDAQSLVITGGRSRFKIRGLDPENFPTLPVVEDDSGVEIGLAALQSMISKVIFAISTEESRFQLNGAFFQVGEEGLEMVATDGHRLALVEAPSAGAGQQEGVLVPRKALQELLRFAGEGAIRYRRGEHHLAFTLDRRTLTCRILEGTFPDYRQVISRQQDKKPVLDREVLQRAVHRVSLLTGERSRGVKLHFAPEVLTISAANPDLGEAREEVPCEYQGEEVQVALNPDYLGQFLASADTTKVRLEIKDAESQCVGYPEGESEQRQLCVIMPMHL
jgi:DNA polymerase-3 subunit beta